MKTLRTVFGICILLSVLILAASPVSASPRSPAVVQQNPVAPTSATQTCHFGIAAVIPFASYDMSTLGVGSYLDFSRNRSASVPANIDYYRVLYIGQTAANWNTFKAHIPGYLTSAPGATWIIGNEPDSEVTYQDHLAPDVYGQRYFEIATMIRQLDPTAKIGFGPIIQATPVRLYYLTLAMNKMITLAGSATAAHALIDFYPIHAYILNEAALFDATGNPTHSWGAGLPVGYDAATWPKPQEIHPENGETWMTFDITIFSNRVKAFRQWMKDQGEQNKPMWITEYGVLFPSQGNPYLYTSDQDAANYMAQTYDFMLGYKDESLGYAADSNRLVQKWTWYSLNDTVTHFGGSLYNPASQRLTPVGERFYAYDPSTTAVPMVNPDLFVVPGSLVLTPISPTGTIGHANYEVTVKFSNKLSLDRQVFALLNLTDGGTLIGTMQVMLPRCSGTFTATYLMKNQVVGAAHDFSASVTLLNGSVTDIDMSNNILDFGSVAMPTPTTYPKPTEYFPIAKK